jgi:hypothetical protein
MTLAVISLAQLAVIALLLVLHHRERAVAARERMALTQRLQAPELAIQEYATRDRPDSPPAIAFEDDEAFHATREAMAEALP